jgi:cell surface protein SprA
VDWQLNNSLTGLQDEQVLGSAFKIQDYRYSYEPTSLRAEQRFSPLLKLSVTWKSALRTELGYERSNISTFAISSKRVTEILSQGIDFSMNYVFQNVKLKLFPKLKNNIDLSIRGSYKNDDDIKYTLSDDLAAALVPGSSPVSNVNDATIQSAHATNSRRITGSISLGYKISTTIASNFEYTFTRRESNSIPTQINHDIRFNVRIAIRSN